jgi:hypothetical protein
MPSNSTGVVGSANLDSAFGAEVVKNMGSIEPQVQI